MTQSLLAPDLAYQPSTPKGYRPNLGLIGCGGITDAHLTAYRQAGYNVVALCDLDEAKAQARQAEFYPQAETYHDYHDLLQRDDVEVVDIATHPAVRVQMIEAALKQGKHVLSQKPFVLDLDVGSRLADLADQQHRKLAVNQNARWAPHFAYIRQAVRAGLIGEIHAMQFAVNWDHNWIVDREFNKIKHVILYDYAIHWFDLVANLMGETPARRVYAAIARAPTQRATPSLLAQSLIEYDQAQVSLVFNANTQHGQSSTTYIAGHKGTITSTGPSIQVQTVTLHTSAGQASPTLTGGWFPDGFHGTMAELLCAIEDERTPDNNARDNLQGLALCFAAIESAETNRPVVPGEVTVLPT